MNTSIRPIRLKGIHLVNDRSPKRRTKYSAGFVGKYEKESKQIELLSLTLAAFALSTLVLGLFMYYRF